jgi:hypothetical protein
MHPIFAGELEDYSLSILLGFMFGTELMLTRMI